MTDSAQHSVDYGGSAIARYIQLATLFRRRIESGHWKLGDRIPTVDELATQCGVARATVRQALGMLAGEGLIERFRAKGTFVRRQPQEELWCAVDTDWSGLLRPRQSARIEILSERRELALETIPYPVGELAPAYWHLHRRHWREEKPFLLTNVYIDERLADRITRRDVETKTALRLIADVPGIVVKDARQTLTIGTADLENARSLAVPLNAPVAFVHRRAVDAAGTTVLVAEGIYRGDVVRLDVKLR